WSWGVSRGLSVRQGILRRAGDPGFDLDRVLGPSAHPTLHPSRQRQGRALHPDRPAHSARPQRDGMPPIHIGSPRSREDRLNVHRVVDPLRHLLNDIAAWGEKLWVGDEVGRAVLGALPWGFPASAGDGPDGWAG